MGLALDQPPQQFITGDSGAAQQQQAQAGATDALHRELQSALAPADDVHRALGSLIGADVQTGQAQPTGSAEVLDSKQQKIADTQEAAMRAVGLGDLQFSGQSDVNGVREAVAQQSRQNAASVAFDNIFDKLGEGSSRSQSGFPGRNDTLQFNNPPLSMQGRQLAIA